MFRFFPISRIKILKNFISEGKINFQKYLEIETARSMDHRALGFEIVDQVYGKDLKALETSCKILG